MDWARALQARSGCPASADALWVLAAERGAWLKLDAGAIAVVNKDQVALFFDAG